jgi:hypothetical protein
MSRYIVLYHAPLDVAQRFARATPEEAALGLKDWIDWSEKLGSALVDPGRPLGVSRRITQSGVTDGREDIIGMSVLEAESMDEALSMVENHHHLRWADECSITVLEEMGIPELA